MCHPTQEDRRVATMALKSKKPVLLIVNKVDKNQKGDLKLWQTLGIKTNTSDFCQPEAGA